MNKMSNRYRLNLEAITLKGHSDNYRPKLELEFDNHDNLFNIIEIAQSKNLFNNENHSIEFILGLKLLSEVVLKHKDHLLFNELKPAIGELMKKLKQL